MPIYEPATSAYAVLESDGQVRPCSEHEAQCGNTTVMTVPRIPARYLSSENRIRFECREKSRIVRRAAAAEAQERTRVPHFVESSASVLFQCLFSTRSFINKISSRQQAETEDRDQYNVTYRWR